MDRQQNLDINAKSLQNLELLKAIYSQILQDPSNGVQEASQNDRDQILDTFIEQMKNAMKQGVLEAKQQIQSQSQIMQLVVPAVDEEGKNQLEENKDQNNDLLPEQKQENQTIENLQAQNQSDIISNIDSSNLEIQNRILGENELVSSNSGISNIPVPVKIEQSVSRVEVNNQPQARGIQVRQEQVILREKQIKEEEKLDQSQLRFDGHDNQREEKKILVDDLNEIGGQHAPEAEGDTEERINDMHQYNLNDNENNINENNYESRNDSCDIIKIDNLIPMFLQIFGRETEFSMTEKFIDFIFNDIELVIEENLKIDPQDSSVSKKNQQFQRKNERIYCELNNIKMLDYYQERRQQLSEVVLSFKKKIEFIFKNYIQNFDQNRIFQSGNEGDSNHYSGGFNHHLSRQEEMHPNNNGNYISHGQERFRSINHISAVSIYEVLHGHIENLQILAEICEINKKSNEGMEIELNELQNTFRKMQQLAISKDATNNHLTDRITELEQELQSKNAEIDLLRQTIDKLSQNNTKQIEQNKENRENLCKFYHEFQIVGQKSQKIIESLNLKPYDEQKEEEEKQILDRVEEFQFYEILDHINQIQDQQAQNLQQLEYYYRDININALKELYQDSYYDKAIKGNLNDNLFFVKLLTRFINFFEIIKRAMPLGEDQKDDITSKVTTMHQNFNQALQKFSESLKVKTIASRDKIKTIYTAEKFSPIILFESDKAIEDLKRSMESEKTKIIIQLDDFLNHGKDILKALNRAILVQQIDRDRAN